MRPKLLGLHPILWASEEVADHPQCCEWAPEQKTIDLPQVFVRGKAKSNMEKQPRILMYGSCVTRDPVDPLLIDKHAVSISAYISKTSFVSQVAAAKDHDLAAPAGDDFAARMIKYDLAKNACQRIAEQDYDFLIFDFIDERLPLIEYQGTVFTGSRFFYEAYPALAKLRRSIDVYSESGQAIALDSLRRFLSRVKEINFPQEKIILHRAWWARSFRDNGKDRLFSERDLSEIHKNNVFLSALYRVFKSEIPDSLTIEVDKSLVVADGAHKWGKDPFHYIESYNEEFRDQLWSHLQNFSLKPRANSISVQRPVTSQKKQTYPQNRRLVEGVGIYSGALDKRSPFVSTYGLDIPYLSHSKEFVAKFRDTGVTFDSNGVPENIFRWGGPYRYSVTIGHHGLSCLARYLDSGDADELTRALSVAAWLIENQGEDGSWSVGFDHNWFPPRCSIIKSPWTSAMGQGLCISLLVRLARLLDLKDGELPVLTSLSRDAMCAAARKALVPFKVDSRNGGVRAKLNDQHVFYEEYPTEPNSFVLNGFIYSLLGLYDFSLLDGDSDARNLYLTGLESLKQCIHLYDLGRGTAYDLTHLSCPGYPPNIARFSYHFIHVQLLSALNLIDGGGFDITLERWSLYLEGWGERTN